MSCDLKSKPKIKSKSWWLRGQSKRLCFDAIEMAKLYGVVLDSTQRLFLLGAMLIDGITEQWINATLIDCQPRQNGKNEVIQARSIYGACILGETILHTAHQLATSKDAFKRAKQAVQSTPALLAEVEQIYNGNGDWSITFKNGGGIYYRARTKDAGRGLTKINLVILDEAQEIKQDELAASLPGLGAAEFSQVWYSGTAGLSYSEFWWGVRRESIIAEHENREVVGTFRVEHSAETWTVVKDKHSEDGYNIIFDPVDPSDRELWFMVNSSLRAGRQTEAFFAEQIKASRLGKKRFAREHLNVWDTLKGHGSKNQTKLTRKQYFEAVEVSSEIKSNLVLSIAVSEDESTTTIVASGRNKDKKIHVETIAKEPGIVWVEKFLAERVKTHKPKRIAFNNFGATRVLSDTLKRVVANPKVKADLVKNSKASYAGACEFFALGIGNKTIVHVGDTHIALAIGMVETEQVSHVNKSWMWANYSTEEGYDIAALEAATVGVSIVEQIPIRQSAYAGGQGVSFA